MNDVKYNLILDNGYVIKDRTEDDIIAMYREERLPYCYVCRSDDPDNVYLISDVLQISDSNNGNFKSISDVESYNTKTLREIQKQNDRQANVKEFWITLVCLVLALIFLVICVVAGDSLSYF